MNRPLANPELIYQLRRPASEVSSQEWESIKRLAFCRVSLCFPIMNTNAPLPHEYVANELHILATQELTATHAAVMLGGPFSPLDRPRVHLKRHILSLSQHIEAATAGGITQVSVAAGSGDVAAEHLADDRHTFCIELCHAVRYLAEMRGIQLALVAGRPGFLNSPAEARDFIDECNSPWIGASIDLSYAVRLASPAEWLRTLGRRVFSVALDLTSPATSDDLSDAIRATAPNCPITISCDGLCEQNTFQRLSAVRAACIV